MIKKRLIGLITVLDGWACQSIGYKKYLPLGRPTIIAKNLDNWGVDEIFIQSIDRSKSSLGPDFSLLNSLSKLCLSTPLIYGGGIASVSDAVKAIALGCERISIDCIIHKNLNLIKDISSRIGSQSIIVSLPLTLEDKELFWFNYLSNTYVKDFRKIEQICEQNLISEILLIDKNNEGKRNSFQKEIYTLFPIKNKPIILFGGISDVKQIKNLFIEDNISAIGIGNFLNFKEHSVQNYKREFDNLKLRPPYFNKD